MAVLTLNFDLDLSKVNSYIWHRWQMLNTLKVYADRPLSLCFCTTIYLLELGHTHMLDKVFICCLNVGLKECVITPF